MLTMHLLLFPLSIYKKKRRQYNKRQLQAQWRHFAKIYSITILIKLRQMAGKNQLFIYNWTTSGTNYIFLSMYTPRSLTVSTILKVASLIAYIVGISFLFFRENVILISHLAILKGRQFFRLQATRVQISVHLQWILNIFD